MQQTVSDAAAAPEDQPLEAVRRPAGQSAQQLLLDGGGDFPGILNILERTFEDVATVTATG